MNGAVKMRMTASNFFSGRTQLKDELAFWDGIRLPNKTWRTTTRGRFDDLNALVTAHWRQEGFVPNRILDVAASSGITTLEWQRSMQADGLEPRMTATDIALDALLVQYLSFYRVLVLDTWKREPLQHDLFGIAIFPFLQMSSTLPLRLVASGLYNIVRRLSPVSSKRVKLVSPEAATSIDFVQDDLFDAASKARLGKFDVIRAANILNRDYFPAPKLVQALTTLRARLTGAGSSLIIARTVADRSNHGTMFRLSADGRFEPSIKVGQGSEISDLVINLPAVNPDTCADRATGEEPTAEL
jgi:hypothetical protein